MFSGINFATETTILGIEGANGSGKSTLLRCVTGLYTPSAGEIQWQIGGEEIPQQKIRFHSGFAAPYLNLYDELSIAENLKFLATSRGLPFDTEKATELLSELGLRRKLSHTFKALSSGQQQRVKLAGAFLMEPAILFLDEPGTNLDEDGKARVRSLVSKFHELGTMILIATNDPSELAWCTKTLSLN